MEIIENCKRAINTCLRNTPLSTESWTMLNGKTAEMSSLEKVQSDQWTRWNSTEMTANGHMCNVKSVIWLVIRESETVVAHAVSLSRSRHKRIQPSCFLSSCITLRKASAFDLGRAMSKADLRFRCFFKVGSCT